VRAQNTCLSSESVGLNTSDGLWKRSIERLSGKRERRASPRAHIGTADWADEQGLRENISTFFRASRYSRPVVGGGGPVMPPSYLPPRGRAAPKSRDIPDSPLAPSLGRDPTSQSHSRPLSSLDCELVTRRLTRSVSRGRTAVWRERPTRNRNVYCKIKKDTCRRATCETAGIHIQYGASIIQDQVEWMGRGRGEGSFDALHR
jgi:hypothetical protein